jgi:uncharacterized protein (DUF1810 family)
MWNIFPQLAGLGHSTIAQHFAIANKEHAAAYLALPVLGQRLHECAALVNSHARTSAAQIFGYPDCLRLHSSLTLFREVSPAEESFTQALRPYYGGDRIRRQCGYCQAAQGNQPPRFSRMGLLRQPLSQSLTLGLLG